MDTLAPIKFFKKASQKDVDYLSTLRKHNINCLDYIVSNLYDEIEPIYDDGDNNTELNVLDYIKKATKSDIENYNLDNEYKIEFNLPINGIKCPINYGDTMNYKQLRINSMEPFEYHYITGDDYANYSKYKFMNDIKIMYVPIKKLTKSDKVGEVLVSGKSKTITLS